MMGHGELRNAQITSASRTPIPSRILRLRPMIQPGQRGVIESTAKVELPFMRAMHGAMYILEVPSVAVMMAVTQLYNFTAAKFRRTFCGICHN